MVTESLGPRDFKRYPVHCEMPMSHSTRTWIIPVCVLLGAAIFYVASEYKIEEAVAATYEPVVSWDNNEIVNVRCARTSTEQHAAEIASNIANNYPYEFEQIQNGGKLRIVKLVSGFNHTRLLHAFVVAELEFQDGHIDRIVVRMTPEVLDSEDIYLDVNAIPNAG